MQYAIREQERIGLDVLVHGEPERTDMCAHLPALVVFGLHLTVTCSAASARCAWAGLALRSQGLGRPYGVCVALSVSASAEQSER